MDTIKLNPLPAALIGIGLGWLLMSARRQSAVGGSQALTPPLSRILSRRHAAGTLFGCPPGPSVVPAAVSLARWSTTAESAARSVDPDRRAAAKTVI